MIEFIDLRHTPNNVLIRAVRGPVDSPRQAAARQRFAELKSLVRVEQTYLDPVLPFATAY